MDDDSFHIAWISVMACPHSRCEINVFHLTFIWCEVVQWNNIISFCGGQNEWKNIGTTSKLDRSMSDFIVLPLGFGIGCSELTMIRLDICKRWYLDLNGTVRHAASVKSICSIWNSFDARLWTGTTWSHFVEDRPFALLHFISISISFYFMIISSTLCIIETSLWVQECVSNSKFSSSMWSLVVCAPSRCSLDARFWNGTTSFHCVEDRTVDLPGVCIGRRCESSLRLPF